MIFTPITTTISNNWTLYGTPPPATVALALNIDDGDIGTIGVDTEYPGAWTLETNLTNSIPVNVSIVRITIKGRCVWNGQPDEMATISVGITTADGMLHVGDLIKMTDFGIDFSEIITLVDCSKLGLPGYPVNSFALYAVSLYGPVTAFFVTSVIIDTLPTPPSRKPCLLSYDCLNVDSNRPPDGGKVTPEVAARIAQGDRRFMPEVI